MNYTENPAMCRVDFFKDTGKWYTTEAISFHDVYELSPHDALTKVIAGRLTDMTAVCLDPYVENSFPVSIPHDRRAKPEPCGCFAGVEDAGLSHTSTCPRK